MEATKPTTSVAAQVVDLRKEYGVGGARVAALRGAGSRSSSPSPSSWAVWPRCCPHAERPDSTSSKPSPPS